MNDQPLGNRLWRVRRRGQWIDATLGQLGEGWRLTFTRKGRVLGALEFGPQIMGDGFESGTLSRRSGVQSAP